jgi:hypothetical protein
VQTAQSVWAGCEGWSDSIGATKAFIFFVPTFLTSLDLLIVLAFPYFFIRIP